jgi:hypothetical protein
MYERQTKHLDLCNQTVTRADKPAKKPVSAWSNNVPWCLRAGNAFQIKPSENLLSTMKKATRQVALFMVFNLDLL